MLYEPVFDAIRIRCQAHRYTQRFITMPLIALLVVVLFANLLQAQCDPILTVIGSGSEVSTRGVSAAGDVNNDGYDDVIVGKGLETVIYSGLDGSVIYTFGIEGMSVAGAGDVNKDGYADVVVGDGESADCGEPGQVHVYSGQTGDLLHLFTPGPGSYQFGGTVSGAGDVNGDGYDDIIIGAGCDNFGGEFSGRAFVYSGQDWSLLYEFVGDPDERLGTWVAEAGDVNNDGFDDVIVTGVIFTAGRCYVFSGQDGSPLYVFNQDTDTTGYYAAGAGDVNNDNFDDIIIGNFWISRADVFSGRDRSYLYTFRGEETWDNFGMSVSGAGDVNNDGFDDMIVGAWLSSVVGTSDGRAYVYSGKEGFLMYTLDAPASSLMGFGASVGGAGDVNQDGFDDVIVGESAHGGEPGLSYVYTLGTGTCIPAECCEDRVGDVNLSGEDDPTISDVAALVDNLFISRQRLWCFEEADVNQSGGDNPNADHISIGDIADLVDYLFITTPEFGVLPDCL